MPPAENPRSILQFGVFEFDTASRELRKQGIRIKLQDQPLQMLTLLLERAGQLVAREEIQKRLRPDNTFVDFDRSINSIVGKLREALGDNAAHPHFIETLARRGYRFTAHVNERTSAPATTTSVPSRTHSPTTTWSLAGALLVIFAAASAFYFRNRPPESPGHPLPEIPLTSYPGFQRFPSFSPEGTRVAFAWDEPGKRPSEIYLKLLDTSAPMKLTHDGERNFAPVWSPDGRLIAFLKAKGALQSAVTIVPALGGHEREVATINFGIGQIFEHWGWLLPTPYLVWSEDGRWLLALDRNDADQPYAVTRISTETGEKRLWPVVRHNGGGYDGYGGLAPSPDKRTLAFTITQDMPISDLYTVPLSKDLQPAGPVRRLTTDGKAIGSVAWGADGHSLVISSVRRGPSELWRLQLSKPSEPERLNISGYQANDVIVSRSGEHMVYSHSLVNSNIWRLALAGLHAGPAASFIASTRTDARPSYSADEEQIAFESDRSGAEEIWVCNRECSDPVQLTSFEKGWAGTPAWSPDGREIAFDGNAGGSWDIYKISAKGGKPVRLTTSPAAEIRPTWSRDGKWIYYSSTQTGNPQVWKMRPDGAGKTQVTRNTGYLARESSDGAALLFVKADNGGIWSIPIDGGDDTELFGEVDGDKCALGKDGYYCIVDREGESTLNFLDLRSRTTKAVAKIPGPLGNGLTVSPSGRYLLYTKLDFTGSELMLVRNFR